MKHIFLNLKRFDVPAELGGVNRLAAVSDWGRAIVEQTQAGLEQYAPEQVEFVQFFPEAHLPAAAAARSENSPVQIGCQGVFRQDVVPGGNFGVFPPRPPRLWAAAGPSSATVKSATTKRASWPKPGSTTPPLSTASSTRRCWPPRPGA